jgi:hypothetical protein
LCDCYFKRISWRSLKERTEKWMDFKCFWRNLGRWDWKTCPNRERKRREEKRREVAEWAIWEWESEWLSSRGDLWFQSQTWQCKDQKTLMKRVNQQKRERESIWVDQLVRYWAIIWPAKGVCLSTIRIWGTGNLTRRQCQVISHICCVG